MDVNMALLRGDFKLLRSLVESGADVNLRDNEYRTALMNCCLHDGQNWAMGSARLLLTHGAKVSYCDKVGRNALMYAVMYQREELVKLFLSALDCDLRHCDKQNHTALWYAASSGNPAIHLMLREILIKYSLLPMVTSKLQNDISKALTQSKGQTGLKVQQRANKTPQQLHKVCSPIKAKYNNYGRLGTKYNRTSYVLPYKTLPVDIWKKRTALYKGENSRQGLNSATVNQSIKEKPFKLGTAKIILGNSPDIRKETNGTPAKKGCDPSQQNNWKRDFQKLVAMFEIQHSSSYCKEAELLPLNQRRFTRCQKEATNNFANNHLGKRRHMARRLSFETLNVHLDKNINGKFRRRRSVAVIPLIRLQQPKSSSTEGEKEKIRI